MQQQGQAAGSGLGLALSGFILLSCGDAVIKSIGGEWPGTAVAALRFSFGAIGLGGLLWWSEGAAGFHFARPSLQTARGTALAFSSLMFFLALFAMPIAEATTIGFVSPMLAVLFSFALLGERPAPAIWPAIVLGLAGVMLVLRPNFAEMGWAAALPLAAAAGFSLMLVLNRMAANEGSVLKMQFATSGVAALILVPVTLMGHISGIAELVVPMPDWTVVARLALVSVTATCSHALVYMATARSSAGTIAPMVYVQLLTSMALGAQFYGELPDAAALAGAALVIAGGLYLWWKS